MYLSICGESEFLWICLTTICQQFGLCDWPSAVVYLQLFVLSVYPMQTADQYVEANRDLIEEQQI